MRRDMGLTLRAWNVLAVALVLAAGILGGVAIDRLLTATPPAEEPRTLDRYLADLKARCALNEEQSAAVVDLLRELTDGVENTLATHRDELVLECTRMRAGAHERIRALLDEEQRRRFDED
ncbi:MAG: hypothetical protein AB1486_04730 [Planctomycetota bacterium]